MCIAIDSSIRTLHKMENFIETYNIIFSDFTLHSVWIAYLIQTHYQNHQINNVLQFRASRHSCRKGLINILMCLDINN